MVQVGHRLGLEGIGHRSRVLVGALFLLGLVSACGVDGDVSILDENGVATDTPELSYDADSTRIEKIVFNGTPICDKTMVDCFILIGSCGGTDDAAHDVTSTNGDGHTMHTEGSCPGAPFSLHFSGNNPIVATVDVGPLPADYVHLSTPMCLYKGLSQTFQVSASSHDDGCANNWARRAGSGGALDSIRKPCTIPNVGPVGQARIRPAPAGTWGELSGGTAKVRMTVTSGNLPELFITNHPWTDCVEPSFGFQRKGTVLHLVEEIYVSSPDAAPPPPPPASVCNPTTQPAPHWGVRNGQCLKSCGGLGGTRCEAGSTCPTGYEPVPGGLAYDCPSCCRAAGTPPPSGGTTPPPAATTYSYEAESQLAHLIGYRDADGWAVRVENGAGFMSYGPYKSWGTGTASVTWRLMIDIREANNDDIVTLDVYNGTRVVAQKLLKRWDFAAGARYQDFTLSGVPVSGGVMEARVVAHGKSYVRLDRIVVTR